jgi:hypothetical protein
VLVASSPDDVGDACAAELSVEGALVTTTGLAGAAGLVARRGTFDAVVAVLPLQIRPVPSDHDGLERAWYDVEHVAAAFRAALPGMAERGWGRLVSVLPSAVKSLHDNPDELGAVTGLAILGMHKAVVADVARAGVCTNAVLRDAHSTAEEIASAVAFLVSEPASYLQGVTIGLDGARSAAVH